MNSNNRQSAAKSLKKEKSSTTILKRSTEGNYPWEKPDSIFYKLTKKKLPKLPRIKCVYVIINIVNKKFYIGSTKRFSKRITKHKSELVSGSHHCSHLQNSVNKHGIESFKVYILEETDNYIEREIYYTELYQARNVGYNLGLVETSRAKGKPVVKLSLFGEYIEEFSNISDACDSVGTDNTTNISAVCNGKALSYKGYIWVLKSKYNPNRKYFYRKSTSSYIGKYKNGNLVKLFKSIREVCKEEKICRATMSRNLNKHSKYEFNSYVYKIY